MKRKNMAYILAALIMSNSIAYASDVIPTAQVSENTSSSVLAKIKGRIGNTDKYSKFSSNTYENGDEKLYSFSWHETEGSMDRLYINCTESGFITGYSASGEYSPYGIEFIKTRLPLDEAMIRAKTLADSLNPDIADETVIEAPASYTSYSFTIKRLKNGLPVSGDIGEITLDKDAAKIVEYNMFYTEDAEFLPNENLIDRNTAIQKYNDNLGLELEYRFKYEYNSKIRKSERSMYIQYAATNDKKISAVSGEAVTPEINSSLYRYSAGGASNFKAMAQEAAADTAFSVAETNEFETLGTLFTKEELSEIISKNEYINLTDDYTLEYFSTQKEAYYDDVPTVYSAELEYTSGDKYIHCTMNAETGEILSFSQYDKSIEKAEENVLPADEAKAIAEAAAMKLGGDKFSEYKYDKASSDESGYFSFTRYVNGAKFPDDTVRISVDMTTEDIQSYYIQYTPFSFPSLDGIIGKDAASEKLFAQTDYEIVYMMTEDKKMTPVYDFTGNQPLFVDAKTGMLINRGTEYMPEGYTYSDIKGHWSESYITTLSELGHGFKEDMFLPDSEITQKDFLILLFGDNISADDAYTRVENFGLDIVRNDNAAVTKADAAKITVSRLGKSYSELAATDIFKAPYPDVTENAGYIAILKGLGIVNGDSDGLFRPDALITRAEAAVIIHNYMLAENR